MTATCPHFGVRDIPTCIGPRSSKPRSFEEFVLTGSGSAGSVLFPIYSQCLSRKEHSIVIGEGCIGCLHCVLGCPGRSGRISINAGYVDGFHTSVKIRVSDSCGTRTGESELKSQWASMNPFSGSLIVFQGVDLGKRAFEHLSIDSFLSKEETKRIAVWVSTVLGAIFGSTASISRELPVKVSSKPRDGRIDVGVLAGKDIYAIETKTDFDSAMNDDRFDIQIPNYQAELDAISSRLGRKKVKQLLVIGGDESKLLPESHPMCSSIAGGRSTAFYNRLSTLNAPLISAQAMLLLGFRSLFDQDVPDQLRRLTSDDSILALLSAGAVMRSKEGFIISPLSDLQSVG